MTSSSRSRSSPGHPPDVVGRPPTQGRQRQQAGPLAGRQPGHDLLPQELAVGTPGSRQREPYQRRPSGQPLHPSRFVAVHLRERRGLTGGEGEVVDAQLDDLTGGPSPSGRERERLTAGQQEVGVGRELSSDVGQQRGRGGGGRQLVEVVEHEADVERRLGPEGLQHPLGRVPSLQRPTERGHDGQRESASVLVTWLAGDPGVDAARCGLVGPHRLGQRGGLPEPGTRHDHGQRHVEAVGQLGEQARADELPAEGRRRSRRSADRASAGVLGHHHPR